MTTAEDLHPELKLATLLCSRLCHDLVSPVGAVNNGLEILEDEDDPEMIRQAMALIRSSANNASAKLQFMRMAFGAAGSVSESVPLDEVRRLAEALTTANSITLDWVGGPPSLDKEVVRLLMNFVLIGYDSLPRGGILRVGVRKEGAINVMVSAEGPKARLIGTAAEILESGADMASLEARAANFQLTYTIAKSLETRIILRIEPELVEIAATI